MCIGFSDEKRDELLLPISSEITSLISTINNYEERFYKDERGIIHLPLAYVNLLREYIMRLYIDSDDPIVSGWNHKSTLEFALQQVRVYPFELTYKKVVLAYKAGFLLHRIASGHPFTDGNKRTAIICTNSFLEYNGYTIGHLPYSKSKKFMLEVARGTKTEMDCKRFVRVYMQKIDTEKD